MAAKEVKFGDSARQKMIAGVCAGFADYFEVDVTLVRAAALIGAVFSGGLLIIAYIIMAIIMPETPPAQNISSTDNK